MGKGAGLCFSSPTQEPVATAQPAAKPAAQPAPAPAPSAPTGHKMTKIAIIYYSTYGHIEKLARQALEGANSVEGVEATLYQVPETLPEEVLKLMHAPPKADVPVISSKELPDFDGFIICAPTRFGTMAAQMKSFIDSTGGLWQKGALVGKPVTMITSSGTQGGGIESTVLTSLPNFVHHGMIFVPTGYSFGERLFDMDEVRAGTAYGASTYAGPTGARQPSELELDFAKHQGSYFAGVAKKLAA